MSYICNSSHHNALCFNTLHTNVMSDEFLRKNFLDYIWQNKWQQKHLLKISH